jgi:hypothetical protein
LIDHAYFAILPLYRRYRHIEIPFLHDAMAAVKLTTGGIKFKSILRHVLLLRPQSSGDVGLMK